MEKYGELVSRDTRRAGKSVRISLVDPGDDRRVLPMDEKKLIERARKGDTAAFWRLRS